MTLRRLLSRVAHKTPEAEAPVFSADCLRISRSGKSVRLVGPEGLYSYYHPEHLFTRLGWDAQTASTLLLRRPVRSILILGLGGATVARQCRALYPGADITGVEISESVLRMARAHFGLDSLGVCVSVTSGQKYLRIARRPFDVIIDDMWWPQLNHPKPVHQEPEWAESVRSRLNEGGMYAVNLFSRSAAPHEVEAAVGRLQKCFTSLREVLPGPPEETSVVAAGSDLCEPREARAKLKRLPGALAIGLRHVRFLTI